MKVGVLNVSFILFIFSVLFFTFSCQKKNLDPGIGSEYEMQNDSICFAIIGDYGQVGDPAFRVSELVKSWSPDFILTLGDNNYNGGKLSTIKENISDYYCDFIYNPDAPDGYQCNGAAAQEKQNRFFPTLGNHDGWNPDSIAPYLQYFSLPGKETFYDFQWGPVHFFCIYSGGDGEAECCESEQAIVLKHEMSNSDSPFKIVYFHHPPYSSSKHGSTENMRWPFEEWGASVVFSGHEHNYQKIFRKDNLDFPYIVNGLGGRQSFYGCDIQPLDENLFETFCYNENYGAIQAIATNDKLSIKFFSISDQETPIDEIVLLK